MLEGFWKNRENPEYPTPRPREKPWKGRRDFLRDLKDVQASAHHTSYKGWSTCRICGVKNGSAEFSFGGWTWPSGFRHYVEDHNVKPSDLFREFVTRRPVR